MQINKPLGGILEYCIVNDFSDIHLTTNSAPIGRLHGQLTPLELEFLKPDYLDEIIDQCLNEAEKIQLYKSFSVDTSISLRDHRFRFNTYKERQGHAIAIRKLEPLNKTIEQLGLPKEIHDLTKLRSGLVLFTGPTGSGKSTSLAALIDEINRTRTCHIITVEDPIEYIHTNKKSLVHQREVGVDVTSFTASLREALREDPDVILVGEMRDLETMRAAITAAETGHLVFSTLHCSDTIGALDRIIGMYPADEQSSLRGQLSMVLKAVVTQTLLTNYHGDGRCVVIEMLANTTAVANLIKNSQFEQIYSLLEIGAESGMLSMDQHLASCVISKKITLEVALLYVRNRQLFLDRIKRLTANTRR